MRCSVMFSVDSGEKKVQPGIDFSKLESKGSAVDRLSRLSDQIYLDQYENKKKHLAVESIGNERVSVKSDERNDSIAELNSFIEQNFSLTSVFPNFQNLKHGKVGLFLIGSDKITRNKMTKFMLLPEIANSSALIQKCERKPEKLRELFSKFEKGGYFIIAAVDQNNKLTKFLGTCGLIEGKKEGDLEMVVYINKDNAKDRIAVQACYELEVLAFNTFKAKNVCFTAIEGNPSVEIIKKLCATHKETDKGYGYYSISAEEFDRQQKQIQYLVNQSAKVGSNTPRL